MTGKIKLGDALTIKKWKNRTSPQSPKRFVAILKKEPNEFKRKLLLIGYFFDRLARNGVTSFLVGGQAVEVYTAGQFVTGDIDITVSDRDKAEKLLSQMSFAREGMIWLNKDLGMAVQIVASYPSRTKMARTIEVEGSEVRIVGVEDLIIDRLVAAKYWRSNPKLDTEQATVLLSVFRNNIDRVYLRKRALEERVRDYLNQISQWNRG